jgi:hypothetical protein
MIQVDCHAEDQGDEPLVLVQVQKKAYQYSRQEMSGSEHGFA